MDGAVVRLNIPPLPEERRKDLVSRSIGAWKRLG